MLIKQALRPLSSVAIDPKKFIILLSARRFRDYLIEAISKATTRIYISTLYLENDEAGREVLTLIYEAKQRNPDLDVVICVDWHRAQRGRIGTPKIKGNIALYQTYAQRYQYSIPIFGVPVRQHELFGVLHLKGFIIDDKVIYTGASLNNVHLHYQDRYRLDRYHVLDSKPLADSMVGFINENIIQNSAVHDLSLGDLPNTKTLKADIRKFRMSLRKASYRLEGQMLNDDQVAVTPIVGIGKRGNDLNQRIIHLLAHAQEEIMLCTPYFNLPRLVFQALKCAMKRGVKVHIIVSDKVANDFYISPTKPFRATGGLPYLYEMNLQKFAKRNEANLVSGSLSIHLWRHESNNFHLKGLWVDRRFILLTGNNINPRAWSLDLENALFISDPNKHLEPKFSAEFDYIFQHTKQLSTYRQLENLSHYPSIPQRLLKRLIRTRINILLNQVL